MYSQTCGGDVGSYFSKQIHLFYIYSMSTNLITRIQPLCFLYWVSADLVQIGCCLVTCFLIFCNKVIYLYMFFLIMCPQSFFLNPSIYLLNVGMVGVHPFYILLMVICFLPSSCTYLLWRNR